MGEIRPKRCEGRELTKDQLVGSAAAAAPTGSKRRRKSDSATRATRDTQPGDAVARAVCDAALLTDALIMPLRHSALKVFDLGPTTSLPADFASKWAETVRNFD